MILPSRCTTKARLLVPSVSLLVFDLERIGGSEEDSPERREEMEKSAAAGSEEPKWNAKGGGEGEKRPFDFSSTSSPLLSLASLLSPPATTTLPLFSSHANPPLPVPTTSPPNLPPTHTHKPKRAQRVPHPPRPQKLLRVRPRPLLGGRGHQLLRLPALRRARRRRGDLRRLQRVHRCGGLAAVPGARVLRRGVWDLLRDGADRAELQRGQGRVLGEEEKFFSFSFFRSSPVFFFRSSLQKTIEQT